MERSEIVRLVWSDVEQQLAEQGFELVEVEYGNEAHGVVLRLYLDMEGGITLGDCQRAAQFLNPFLDSCDYLDSRYMLEVSSPGIARPVRKPADFARFAGERVKLQSYAAVLGRKKFTGTLEAFQDDCVIVGCDGEQYEIHVENLKHCHLDR